ncbi:MAG: methylenetetrahydrofolate--tRNA-(uracil(54)-C(5))-methyltransferase (FADH(2)-oxidizing) TrmFO [Oscillospiraceae bacterium]|nr:methylenetetrahydrofolate--tRNA-(uracil(54)-C(5))-methyltransferase (FADH(2)-oxidizing) TrmFO [Oscillospiraceae bacterium]
MKVSVIGGGLAGCEAALFLANNGVEVDLYEMKPTEHSPAHKYDGLAELVCSNSLKAERTASAAGMLKAEMAMLGSVVVKAGYANRVAAGGALAVDREGFSDYITARIKNHPKINLIEKRVDKLPEGYVIAATGPLTHDILSKEYMALCGENHLSFFDAAAPIVTLDSIDMEKVFFAARYGRGDDDYINCPMNKEEYEQFYQALVAGETVQLKEFEHQSLKVYEGCMPVEVMAKRGEDTLRFGPLKPVGLRDPRTGHRPWAVVQLRKENAQGSMYNLVGFQTNLKFPEQKRIFSMIPGLENAQFVRYGVMHRNTFLNSPKLLNSSFCMKSNPKIYFAGQITGVEGYIESAASGLLAAFNLLLVLRGKQPVLLPETTMMGALSRYISDESITDFQPMGCNMGLLPPLPERVREKALRYELTANRGLEDLKNKLSEFDDIIFSQE